MHLNAPERTVGRSVGHTEMQTDVFLVEAVVADNTGLVVGLKYLGLRLSDPDAIRFPPDADKSRRINMKPFEQGFSRKEATNI